LVFAAIARHKVTGALENRSDHLCHLLQTFVTGNVSVVVVIELAVIDVTKYQ